MSELSGRLDGRNRQGLEFKGLRTSGKILHLFHSDWLSAKEERVFIEVEGTEPTGPFSFSNTQARLLSSDTAKS